MNKERRKALQAIIDQLETLLTPILYRISFIMSRLFLKKNLYF